MSQLPDERVVVRDHPDHQDEAVVLDTFGNPIIYTSARQTDAEILRGLDVGHPDHGDNDHLTSIDGGHRQHDLKSGFDQNRRADVTVQ